MSDLDLSAAAEAARLALHKIGGGVTLTSPDGDGLCLNDAYTAMVAAAAPLIEVQVRAQIVAKIEAATLPWAFDSFARHALAYAVHIARGDS